MERSKTHRSLSTSRERLKESVESLKTILKALEDTGTRPISDRELSELKESIRKAIARAEPLMRQPLTEEKQTAV